MLTPRSLSRAAALCVVAVLVFGAFQLRGLSGWHMARMSLAPALDGEAYTFDSANDRLAVVSASGSNRLGPALFALTVSAAGARVLIGGENQVLLSEDGGNTVTTVIRDIHMWASALSGADAAVVSWGRRIYVSHDGGTNWAVADARPSDLQINQLLITHDAWLGAGQVGVLISRDHGASWTLQPGAPERATALFDAGDRLLLGTWSGGLYQSIDQGLTWSLLRTYPSGIWALGGGGLVGTATGLYVDGQRASGVLGALEISAVGVSGRTRFAVAPGSRVWADGGSGWHQVQSGRGS